jgi:hypothetical protein
MSKVMAQVCFPNQGPGFSSFPPNHYSGPQFQNQSYLGPSQAYQPQQYYFPQGNVQLSQPPLFGRGFNCQPRFMNRSFQTSFGRAQMQPPSFGMMALPFLGQGLSSLVNYFENKPRPRGQSFREFSSYRGRSSSSDRSSRIYDDDFYSPKKDDGGPSAVPDSNSAGGNFNTSLPEVEEKQEKKEKPQTTQNWSQQTPDKRVATDEEKGLDLSDQEARPIPREELETPSPGATPPRPTQDLVEDVIIQADELPDMVQGPLTRDGCLDLIREQTKENGPLQGAYRIMATFYQDCHSITNILNSKTPLPDLKVSIKENMDKDKMRELHQKDLENYFEQHPYLKDRNLDQNPGQCRDLKKSPPVFSFGAKARYKGGPDGDINLFRNQSKSPICEFSNIACNSHPVTALDCSGFVHAALRASGLKVQRGPEPADYNTWGFNDVVINGDSCLEELSFSAEHTLASGDIISQSGHHMFMVSGVGEDPLGVKKALKNRDCSSISKSDFDFTFIQSGASRSIGVAHLSSDYPEVSTTIFNNLWAMAQEACNKAQSGEGRLRARTTNEEYSMVVVRHVGDSDPECVQESKPKLEGEECVEDCLDES